jgi:hypothetical protein
MAKDTSSVSEEATVQVTEEPVSVDPSDIVVDDEPAPFVPSCRDSDCPWHVAETRLGLPAREVTVDQYDGYRILTAQAAEGNEVHLHQNLGRF